MSATFVVHTVNGTWAMGCCDALHGYDVINAEFTTRKEAEDAAKAHRAEDREEAAGHESRMAHCCRACGRPL